MADLYDSTFYLKIVKFILTEKQLQRYGYPLPHPSGQKGRATIYAKNARNEAWKTSVPNQRICERCGGSYMVDKNGFAIKQEICTHHSGSKIQKWSGIKYTCCEKFEPTPKCAIAEGHVWRYVDYEHLYGFIETLPKDIAAEKQGVYAIDCEMSYTTQGLELTKVTVVNEKCDIVYETLIKPENPIIDYNTAFSGVTETDMKHVTTTLADVQAKLLTLFSKNTILIGHSLESDLRALKLIHTTVVDTSIVFPHRQGLPYRRALKTLSAEYLGKIIQKQASGHESSEDAIVCIQLMKLKVNN